MSVIGFVIRGISPSEKPADRRALASNLW